MVISLPFSRFNKRPAENCEFLLLVGIYCPADGLFWIFVTPWTKKTRMMELPDVGWMEVGGLV